METARFLIYIKSFNFTATLEIILVKTLWEDTTQAELNVKELLGEMSARENEKGVKGGWGSRSDKG